ncbi:hypothetical protein J2T57_001385 [Natronocella acetinitrilica]|uniref:Uncharacterized protein n=1 Tax=Natronocella acetinitrilica TaxID=414046 RepID=A0AAE3KBY8_9GAMM|nr:hypothetical protein [Natronocella acetinitrilica]MCP1674283.1 hypothetical protein [Natronocella acetinitrilica]
MGTRQEFERRYEELTRLGEANMRKAQSDEGDFLGALRALHSRMTLCQAAAIVLLLSLLIIGGAEILRSPAEIYATTQDGRVVPVEPVGVDYRGGR